MQLGPVRFRAEEEHHRQGARSKVVTSEPEDSPIRAVPQLVLKKTTDGGHLRQRSVFMGRGGNTTNRVSRPPRTCPTRAVCWWRQS